MTNNIIEKCECGARFDVYSEADLGEIMALFKEWRRIHDCTPKAKSPQKVELTDG